MLDGVLLLFLGIEIWLINCFWNIRVALRNSSLVRLVQTDLLIWADSAGWTGREILTVHDEWKKALVTVLVEVEGVKMEMWKSNTSSAGTDLTLDLHQWWW